jgi:sugar transferase (PEP-CTERM/EpsH1 system associated)
MQLPYPPDTGERIRNFNLIKALSQNNDIALISLIQSADENKHVPEMLEYCSSVETVKLKRVSKLKHVPGILFCLLRGEPADNKFYFLEEMVVKIREAVARRCFDVVQIEHSYMASYARILPLRDGPKRILSLHNIESIRLKRMAGIEKDVIKKFRFLLNWLWMRKWEHIIAEKFDKCIVMSTVDVGVIPNGVDTDLIQISPVESSSRNLLFVGTFAYEPNVDAVLYFSDKIFPLIQRQLPDCKFVIVGGHPSRKVLTLTKKPGIVVTGYAEDLREYYEHCAVVVVPLRAGGGTRGKILEAMAFGRPVVATTMGAEGLEVQHGENILISDDAQNFADYVITLIRDSRLRTRLIRNARRIVESRYDWKTIARLFEDVYTDCLVARREAK